MSRRLPPSETAYLHPTLVLLAASTAGEPTTFHEDARGGAVRIYPTAAERAGGRGGLEVRVEERQFPNGDRDLCLTVAARPGRPEAYRFPASPTARWLRDVVAERADARAQSARKPDTAAAWAALAQRLRAT